MFELLVRLADTYGNSRCTTTAAIPAAPPSSVKYGKSYRSATEARPDLDGSSTAARPAHFDFALGDEVGTDGDYSSGDGQALRREDVTLLGNEAGEESLAVPPCRSPLAATVDLKRVADAAPILALGVDIGVIACCPEEAIEMEVADIYVQAVAEGVAQASVDAGDVIPTVTKVKGSTKARRNGNRAANLAAVAAAQ